MIVHGAERASGPAHPAVIRCPECGRRVTGACPLHAAVGALAGDSDVSPASLPPLPEIPGYEDFRFVARGGFGLVYTARPRGRAQRVAIKVARDDRPDAARRLAEEMRVLVDIGPPHVPAVLDQGQTAAGAPWFAMEYMGDDTLASRLTDLASPLPLEEALDLATLVVRTLAAVHERGYVHRDLKPENIFITGPHDARRSPAPGAALIDFGLVIGPEDPGAVAGDISGERTVFGTTDYMSPEQLEGEVAVDARADIYAMGVLLHELITGRSPFFGPRAVVREKHLSHRPPRMSAVAPEQGIPAALDDVAARCLAKDKSDRFPAARELLRALEAVRDAEDPAPSSMAHSRSFASGGRPPESRAVVEAKQLSCAVLFFESSAAPTVVQARLKAVSGQVAHSAGGRYAAVFAQEQSDNPAQRAALAARSFVRSGLCARVRVDLASVTAQVRRDGARRFLNPALARADLYPGPGDPEIVVTPAAAAVLPDRGAGAAAEPAASVTGELVGAVMTAAQTALLGREELLNTLLASARSTAGRAGSAVVVVTGDTGMGKSHLYRELSARLSSGGPPGTLLALRAREPLLGDVDPTLAEIVRRAGRPPSSGEEADAARSEVLAAVLEEGASRCASPGSGAESAPRGPAPSAVRALGAAPGALRSAITSAAGEALRRQAADQPLFVVIDDADAAGDIALAALEYAAAAEAGAPVWVCAIGRPSLLQEHPTWGERAARRELHALGPLDPDSAEQLCRRHLLPVESVPTPVVRSLVARAAATPLLLVELVRGLHRQGLVRRSPKGESFYLAADELDRLPDLPLVEWLAQREIAGLSPALRDHARLIALLGDDAAEAELEGVVRAIDELGGGADFPLDTGVATRRLLSAGVVTRDAEGRVRYRQSLVRQALAREAPEAFRRLVHEAAVAFYRGAGAMPGHRRLSQLAAHAAAAGLAEEAARAFLTLAEESRAWHAYLEAERLYSRALEQPGIPSADRAAAHRGRGLMRYRLARYHDALADFAVARAHAEDTGDTMAVVDLLLDEATALDWMDDFATSQERVLEADRRLPEGAPPLYRARLLLGLGRSAKHFNRSEEAATLLERAERAAELLGNDGYETRVIALLLLGFVLPGINRAEHAQRVLETAVTLCETHGDKVHLGGALQTRGMLRGMSGDRAGMTADVERAIAIAREMGQTSLELIAEFNFGEFLLLMGDSTAAAPHIARVRELDLRVTGYPGRAVVALLEARHRLFVGDLEAAAEMTRRVREHQTEMSARGETDRLMVPSDDVLCMAVELSAARVVDGRWQGLEARSERFSFGQERIEVIETRAVTLAREGQVTEAREHLLRAIALAARIPNAMGGRLAARLAAIDAKLL